MFKRRLIQAVAVWLCVGAAVRADSIVKSDGQSTGDVVEMTAEEVTIELRGRRTKVPVNQIEAVRYSEEPARLNTARQAIKAGRYEDAVTGLETIKVDEIKRAEVKQDVEFYTALAMARVALAGTDSKALVDTFLAEDSAYASKLKASEGLGPVVPRVDLSPDAERRLLDEAQRNARLKLQIIGGAIAAAAILVFTGLCAAIWLAVFRFGAG